MRAVDRFFHVVDRLTWVLSEFCGGLVLVMASLVIFEVFMRYVVGHPPLLADEISGYMVVALTALGLPYLWKEGGHIRVEALIDRLPRWLAIRLRIATLIIALAFGVALVLGAVEFIVRSFSVGRTSDSWLRVPLAWPQMTILIGFSLLSMQIAASMRRALKVTKAGDAIEEERN